METMTNNIFLVGPQVSGASFIGRIDEVNALSADLFDGRSSISLVGPTRIGKSSLVNCVLEKNKNREKIMILRLCMAEYTCAVSFWTDLMDQLREVVEDSGAWDNALEELFGEFDDLQIDDSMWHTVFKRILRRVFKKLVSKELRVVLAIDEFDGIMTVFGSGETSIPHYQLLRSIYSEYHNYRTNGVIISRRTLKFMEQKVPSLSTFHGVFERKTLDAFNENDMIAFHNALAGCGVTLEQSGQSLLQYYTGGNPYLCSIFGKRLVELLPETHQCNDRCVRRVYAERKADILEYYEDLIDRLSDDGHLVPLLYLSLGSTTQLAKGTDVETMYSLGILRKDNCFGHYAYCADFMKYLRTKPLSVPYWELLNGAENHLKNFLGKHFPQLRDADYERIQGSGGMILRSRLSEEFPPLANQWTALERSFASLAARTSNPTLLDALSLGDVVDLVLARWDADCRHYFRSNDWESKLQLIRRLYSPLSAAQSQYITEQELSICSQYCKELLLLEL